ncbi:MAG: hypothetical protein AMXMBFR67_22590 [Nitrospira sp.]
MCVRTHADYPPKHRFDIIKAPYDDKEKPREAFPGKLGSLTMSGQGASPSLHVCFDLAVGIGDPLLSPHPGGALS